MFTKNRDRLLDADVAAKFMAAVLGHGEVRPLLSNEHFSVDGTLVEAWASLKSFRAKDGSDERPKPGRNGERDFHGEKRTNDTHASTTDPDAKLYRKSSNTAPPRRARRRIRGRPQHQNCRRFTVHRLRPQQSQPTETMVSTLGRGSRFGDAFDRAREALWWPTVASSATPLPSPRWWSDKTLVEWMCGGTVPSDVRRPPPDQHPRMGSRTQVQVRIDPSTGTADDGMLFLHDVIETLEHAAEWAVGVAVALPEPASPTIARLGSDSRNAWVESVPPEVFELPAAIRSGFQANPTRRMRVMLATPARFEKCGWLPDSFDAVDDKGEVAFRGALPGIDGRLTLRAAFVGRPQHVSGWDVAAGAAKPTDRLAPPGSAYFLERTEGGAFTIWEIEALWKNAIGASIELGYGRLLPGLWPHY